MNSSSQNSANPIAEVSRGVRGELIIPSVVRRLVLGRQGVDGEFVIPKKLLPLVPGRNSAHAGES